MYETNIASVVTLITTILPVLLILTVLFYILREAKKNTEAGSSRSPKDYIFLGAFWLALGIVNLILEANLHSNHHSAAFQQVYGTFAIAFGSYTIGLGVGKSNKNDSLVSKAKRRP